MTARPTLPEYIAAAHPDGPPPGLVPVRLVPVEAFGGDCRCHEDRELGEDLHDCHGFSYGLCDAVEAWSDCNRAHGRIYRRDEDESRRNPDEVIVVWVVPEGAAKFERVFGDDPPVGTRRMVTEEFLRDLVGALAIEELGLDGRPYNQLRAHGIRHICEVLKLTEDDLYAIRNMGAKSVANIKERLMVEFGLTLAPGKDSDGG